MKNLQLSGFILIFVLFSSCLKNNEDTIQYEKATIKSFSKVGDLFIQNMGIALNTLGNSKSLVDIADELPKIEEIIYQRREYVNSKLQYPHWSLSLENCNKILAKTKVGNQIIQSGEITDIQNFLIQSGWESNDIIALNEIYLITLDKSKSFDEMLNLLNRKELSLIKEGRYNYKTEEPMKILKASIFYWSNNYYDWEKLNTTKLQERYCGHDGAWFRETVYNMGRDAMFSGAIGAVVGDGPGAVAGAMYGAAASGIASLFRGC